jgi:hypothetical protein
MKHIIILATILSIGLFSCEEVIDLPLNNANQKIVVEAFTSNIEGRSYVKLTKTSNVYTTDHFETVSDASVIITDDLGNNYPFTESTEEAGLYLLPGYKVEPNTTYTIKIVSGDTEITGTTESSYVPSFDFVFAGPKGDLPDEVKNGLGFFPDDFRVVFYLFSDPVPVGDNYRIISYKNNKRQSDMYIANDILGSGEQFGGILFGANVDSSDTVFLELMTMDKANYDYFYSLTNNTSTGPFAATPSNPVSNISENALGFFGAYLMDTLTTITF